MDIFDEPSRKPLPKTPDLGEIRYVAMKAAASLIPGGGELFSLLTSPLAQRRDVWMEDLERRLRDLEGRVEGFRFDELGQNKEFVSAVLHATHAALRTHQAEKLEALRNAVLNVAIGSGSAPSEDLQLIFLNLVDSFTPAHLKILRFCQHSDNNTVRDEFRRQRDLTDQVVRDLNERGLINDTRPYAARDADTSESLIYYNWDVTNLGRQFLAFIKSPEVEKA